MEIKVLGGCCKKSKEFFAHTQEAVKNLGLNTEVEEVSDFIEISKYQVLQTPALVLNDKVLCSGRHLNQKEIEELLTKNIK